MRKNVTYFAGAVLSLLSFTSVFAQSSCVFEEKNGIVAFEAEDYASQEKTDKREWFIIGGGDTTPTPDPDGSHAASASGGKYLEILPDTRVTHSDKLISGTNFSNTPGSMAILKYKVFFNNPDKYFVWVRLYSTGSEDNGVHVGIDGTWPTSGERMQWCQGKNQWTWESKQRTDANHCGEEQKIFLDVPTAGEHTIMFSMREDGVEIDKIILSKAYTKPSGNGSAVQTKSCGESTADGVAVSGTLQRWHKVTLTCDGPNTSEIASKNPFMDYRFDAIFTHESGASYKVPVNSINI